MNKIPFGDLSRQYKENTREFDNIVKSALKKGIFILGENVLKFEQEFASYCGCSFGIGVGSGTEALYLALLACGIQEGDEVITVANTAVPTISAVRSAKAIPVFVDIEKDSYNIDPDLIESKITKKTRAIIPVHLYGNPCRIDRIVNIAKKYDLKVVEDCAQAHGAECNGRKVGSFGDSGCFSFYPSKNLGAFGDGGMVVTNNKEISESLKLLRNYGQKNRYISVIEGFNSRLDEIQAALLRFKLTRLDEWNSMRKLIAQKYSEGLKDTDIVVPTEASGGKHVFHLYVIRTDKRDSLMEYLGSQGIQTLIHYPVPVHLMPAYKALKVPEGALPNTEKISNKIVSLPIYPELKADEIEYIIKKVVYFTRNFR